ncbi:S46 family peptidase [Gloeobacter violaceus]|uniref:Dipeptidyl-peptidase n=1 Tax=Gloeobacter violaceus (strain ATCC 29082 / PCC 7421) TaxID=251221 RepID=Q7NHA9_GLOVI|nr:S46 family peptidase [Gloeobacter violaceus]BAC90569.1 gll2628 [Gloeobacter violaceus PCC 7421]
MTRFRRAAGKARRILRMVGWCLAIGAVVPSGGRAEEGMWTYDNFPSEQVAKKYGFKPDAAWLERVRLASLRLAGGCSGSFVSPNGLVMTNHHCAATCIEELSTAQQNYIESGFLARRPEAELKCPDVELNQLTAIEDVTERVKKATANLSGQQFSDAQKAEFARIEKACADATGLRCDVVNLYQGGLYNLYKYKRYQDVRLVFAPEFRIAFFGGDPDNFNFPRYDLDVTFLRAYDKSQPVKTEHYLPLSPTGPKAGELVFVSGSPGSTSRLFTVAQLEFLRDVVFPESLKRRAELRGVLTQFARQGPEQRRISQETLFGVENSFKAINGQQQALLDREFFGRKVAAEQKLRAAVARDPALERKYGKAWDEIALIEKRYETFYRPYLLVERGAAFNSKLFDIARTLVRAAQERPKPNEKRLREFRDSALPSLTQSLFSEAPIYGDLDEVTLTFSLTKLREYLGTDDPLVRQVLGKESPEEVARRLVQGTKLTNVALRKLLWEGGAAAVAASSDPMIRFAVAVDPAARALRLRYEREIEGPVNQNSELIAQALFAQTGTSVYPDATFSPRLSYGAVEGYEHNGRRVEPFTDMAGAFERATGKDPYALPPSWLAAKDRLNLATPFNFVTTNDIIGGNSGSPVIDSRAQAVGLIFDGNIHSLGGAFGFDAALNRAVAVDSRALIEALRAVYGAGALVDELQPKGRSAFTL